jgi:hypothetical protein
MVRDANAVQPEKSAGEDLEPYYRLIEMQKQMIDLIQQNAHAERECAALRAELARELEAMTRARRRLPDRLRLSASSLLRRLLKRDQDEGQPQEWSQSFSNRAPAPQRSRTSL